MLIKRMMLATIVGVSLVISPAWGCSPPPLPPELPGESDDAYWARIMRSGRQLELEEATRRIDAGLRTADLIFIARDTIWQPPARPLPVRSKVRPSVRRPLGGQVARPHWGPVPPLPARKERIGLSNPSYFAPIAWYRGPPSRAWFKVSRDYSTCGPMSFGDTDHSQLGDLYLFLARKGPVSEATLIDAIALDSIDHPALNAFVAKVRKAPPPAR